MALKTRSRFSLPPPCLSRLNGHSPTENLLCPSAPRDPLLPSRQTHGLFCRLHSKCRTHLKNAVDKRKGFAEVENNFHPAFRFFFLENFPEPLAWYNSRLTFTRYCTSLDINILPCFFFFYASIVPSSLVGVIVAVVVAVVVKNDFLLAFFFLPPICLVGITDGLFSCHFFFCFPFRFGGFAWKKRARRATVMYRPPLRPTRARQRAPVYTRTQKCMWTALSEVVRSAGISCPPPPPKPSAPSRRNRSFLFLSCPPSRERASFTPARFFLPRPTHTRAPTPLAYRSPNPT